MIVFVTVILACELDCICNLICSVLLFGMHLSRLYESRGSTLIPHILLPAHIKEHEGRKLCFLPVCHHFWWEFCLSCFCKQYEIQLLQDSKTNRKVVPIQGSPGPQHQFETTETSNLVNFMS